MDTIFHIDMDAFFVSVECLLNPKLKGKAVVVGKDASRGVVAAASYEARKFGVFSAMSCVKAKQLCPHLIFVYSGKEYYSEVSKKVMACIKKYSPAVEIMGLDEAYLDASGIWKEYESPYKMAEIIQKDIFQTTGGLTASIGIAPLRFLAKIASDLNKPHGIAEIQNHEVENFIKNLDLYKIPSVGKKFLKALHSFGIHTGRDAQKYSKDFFERTFGKQGIMLFERVNGIDTTPITPYHEPKSESTEITLEEDTKDKDILKQYLRQHAERVGQGLRKINKKASVITLKIKYTDFTQITRQTPLPLPTYSTKTLYEVACYLLDKENLLKDVRLIGLGASQFSIKAKTEQISLFNDNELNKKSHFNTDSCIEKQRDNLDSTLDLIRAKYGKNILK